MDRIDPNPPLADGAPGRYVPVGTIPSMPPGLAPPTSAYLPNTLPPPLALAEIVTPLWADLERATGAVRELSGRIATMPDPMILAAPFARREARSSSMIENTFATTEEVAMLEIGEESEPSRSAEIREVANYYQALQHSLRSELPISPRLISDVHRILLTGVRGERLQPGEFRRTQNFIVRRRGSDASIKFVPPPEREVTALLDNLSEYAAISGQEGLPLLVRIAICHYQFETIHPFNDGNGRIGRLIAALQLHRSGDTSHPVLYLSDELAKDTDRYNALMLDVSVNGNWIPWIKFFVNAVELQAKSAIRQVVRLADLRAKYREMIGQSKSATENAVRLMESLFEIPVVNARRAVWVMGLTDAAVRHHINHFVTLGILKPLEGRKYRKVWFADEIIRVVDGD